MDMHQDWADRGQSLELEAGVDDVRWAGVSRLGQLAVGAPMFSIWWQVRGTGGVESREGRFRLAAGDWIAFERDSHPMLQADRTGLAVGLAMSQELMRGLALARGHGLFAGRGRVPDGERLLTFRLWRDAARRHRLTPPQNVGAQARMLQPLLIQLALLQRDLAARLGRCPGRSRNRKGQVFGRLQRARLYLEGHRDRVVSLSELAALANFSSWYFSKTFHSIYDETPQAASQRLRLERACQLLEETTLVVGEVGAACGFDNACSFARAFRANVGTTASAYRAHARPGTPNAAQAGAGSWQAPRQQRT